MMGFRKTTRWRGALAAALAAAALLTVGAAAEPSAGGRQEDLDFLYTTLKEKHPNLFANTPESEFLERKAEIEETLATQSDFDFALDCASLAALAKDSHTSVSLGRDVGETHYWLFDMDWYDGHWYLAAADAAHRDLLGTEVTALNGLSPDAVQEKFSGFLSADNPVKLRRSFRQMCYVQEPYLYLGLAKAGQPLSVTVQSKDGKSHALTAEAVSLEAYRDEAVRLETGKPAPTAYVSNTNYSAKSLDDSAYYIQYNVCMEDPELPMETFAAQVWRALDAQRYQRVIVDLRNNGGGSDGVIWPLLEILKAERSRGVEVVGLIGEATFSSAIINAVELQELGAVLVGEPTSGSVDHFGAVAAYTLPNSKLKLGVSSKYIDLATLLDAAAGRDVESLRPDVEAEQTLPDYLAGKDSAVEYLLSHREPLAQAERPDAPLSRGRFIGQIHAAAAPLFAAGSGGDGSWDDPPFADLLGIEWFLHPLNWAYQKDVAKGTGDGGFAAAKPITWQESAVFLTRAAGALHLEGASVRTAPLPAALPVSDWNRAAVEQAWKWGLLPADADYTIQPNRAQGEAMAAALAAMKK